MEKYSKAHSTAALYDGSRRFGRIEASGVDALDLLHRMSTNDLMPLIGKSGSGAQTVLTTEKGRIIDHLIVLSQGNSAMLICSGGNEANVISWLDKFVIMEDARFTDTSDRYAQYILTGPDALAIAQEIASSDLTGLETLHWIPVEINGKHVMLQRSPRIIESGFTIFTERDNAETVFAALQEIVHRYNGAVIDDETFETIRIEAGIPLMPSELNEKHNPLEATLIASISWTKGCYIGQEVIARLDTYDKVQRHLMGVVSENGGVITTGDPLEQGGEQIGSITSAVYSPSLGKYIGLAYIKTAFANPNARIQLPSGSAVLTKLPFTTDN